MDAYLSRIRQLVESLLILTLLTGQDFLSLAGPGFRDCTRIAASDPKIWRDILISNREELLAQSKIFQRNLHALEVMISSGNGEALEGLIEQASVTRSQWSMSKNNK